MTSSTEQAPQLYTLAKGSYQLYSHSNPPPKADSRWLLVGGAEVAFKELRKSIFKLLEEEGDRIYLLIGDPGNGKSSCCLALGAQATEINLLDVSDPADEAFPLRAEREFKVAFSIVSGEEFDDVGPAVLRELRLSIFDDQERALRAIAVEGLNRSMTGARRLAAGTRRVGKVGMKVLRHLSGGLVDEEGAEWAKDLSRSLEKFGVEDRGVIKYDVAAVHKSLWRKIQGITIVGSLARRAALAAARRYSFTDAEGRWWRAIAETRQRRPSELLAAPENGVPKDDRVLLEDLYAICSAAGVNLLLLMFDDCDLRRDMITPLKELIRFAEGKNTSTRVAVVITATDDAVKKLKLESDSSGLGRRLKKKYKLDPPERADLAFPAPRGRNMT